MSNSLFELSQNLCNVPLVGQTDHDVQLLQFHVDRVVVFHEEHFHLMLEDVWSGKQGDSQRFSFTGTLQGDVIYKDTKKIRLRKGEEFSNKFIIKYLF